MYTHNVEILFNRTDLGIPQQHRILSESLKGPPGIALPRGDLPVLHCPAELMHIDFQF